MAIKKEIEINVNTGKSTQEVKGLFDSLNNSVSEAKGTTETLSSGLKSVSDNFKLLGVESKGVGEAISATDKVVSGFNTTQEIANNLSKQGTIFTNLYSKATSIASVAQKAYATAIGTSTGALKLFRIALISTGIGAIVVGLGLLIANFEKVSKWVQDITAKFGGWRNILMFISPPIWLIIKALEALGIIDDEATSKAKANAEARIKANRKESLELDKKKKSTEDYYDLEIRKAKASGKNTEEVEAQKRSALLATLKAQNELERSWIRTSNATEEDIKRWNERQVAIKNLLNDIEVADLESKKKQEDKAKELAEKQKQVNEKARQEAEANKKALLQIEENFRKQSEDLQDKTDAERLARAKARQLAEIEQMKGTTADKEKARLQVIDFFNGKEKELAEKTAKENQEKEKERLFKISGIREEALIKEKELLAKTDQEKFNIELEKLETERAKKEQELIELGVEQEQRLEILSFYKTKEQELKDEFSKQELEKEKILQQQRIAMTANTLGNIANLLGQNSKAGKAFAVAQSLINTYQGVTAELATKTATPFEFGLKVANIATTVAIGMKSVRDILKTNPSAGGGNVSVPSAGGGGAPQFNVVGNTGVNQIAETLATQEPQRAYVVSNDITSQQALDRNIVQNATLG
jgi:hypothetical protein